MHPYPVQVGGDCSCHDMIYLNDTDLIQMSSINLEVTTANGALTEIGNPWMIAGDEFNSPHGLQQM